MTSAGRHYLYVAPDLLRSVLFTNASLEQTTERHPVVFDIPPVQPVADILEELRRSQAGGVVFELAEGLPSARHLQLVGEVLRSDRRAWIYWPAEQAVECVDVERLQSLHRHVTAVTWLKRVGGPVDRAAASMQRLPAGLRWIYRGAFSVRRSDILSKLDLLVMNARPVPLEAVRAGGVARLPACGAYLRTDFWMRAQNDRRTVLVANELAVAGSRVLCLLPGHFGQLDEAGVQQAVMDEPPQTEGQDAIVLASVHYGPLVKAACQASRPAYLYERLAAGSTAGAEVSQRLGIPYIVEHPGFDVMLHEALGGAGSLYAELYARAEELALRQATIVVVGESGQKDALVSRGIDAARVMVDARDAGLGARLAEFIAAQTADVRRADRIQTGDAYKDQVQNQWDYNPVGSHHARESQPHTLEWFVEVEKHRYQVYAPWMPATMEFAGHAGHDVLEIGGGMGTDLAQFAAHGAAVTDLDLSAGHLQLAEENFRLRGLEGRFIHYDAETLPFDDGSFDVVYSNGVLHHTPNTSAVVREIRRVLRPGGRTILMFYAEDSLHHWRNLVWGLGVKQGLLQRVSMGEIMSRSVERTANDAAPLVKVYTEARLRALFKDFAAVEILQRQLLAEELPPVLRWTLSASERWLGWNLIIKATRN